MSYGGIGRMQNPECRMQNAMVHRLSSIVHGPWTMVHGPSSFVFYLWSLVVGRSLFITSKIMERSQQALDPPTREARDHVLSSR